jgi:hypothetical protein
MYETPARQRPPASVPGMPMSGGREPARRLRPRRALDTVLVAAVMVLAVAAVVQALRSDGTETVRAERQTETEARPDPPQVTTTGAEPDGALPIVPLPGDVRQAGGLLWWVDENCDAAALHVASGAVARLPGRRCRLWPSPTGERAVATAPRRSDAFEGRGLVVFDYARGAARLGDGTVLEHTPGVLAGELAWSPDGSQLAACFDTDAGTVVDVFDLEAGTRSTRDGECFPGWLADGRPAGARGAVGVHVADRDVLGPDAATVFLPGVEPGSRRVVSALAGGDGVVALALVAVAPDRLWPTSASVTVLFPEGRLRFSAGLRADVLPAAVGLSPAGDAVWYFNAASGVAHVLAVPGGRRLLPPFDARAVAWQPAGGFVAVARKTSIVLARWPQEYEVARVRVRAQGLAWTAAPQG